MTEASTYIQALELSDLRSTNEAAAAIGITAAQLRKLVLRGVIEPIPLSSRPARYGRGRVPHSYAFTLRQIDAYNAGAESVPLIDSERDQVLCTNEAAAFIDVGVNVIKQAHHVHKTLPGKRIGRDAAYLRRDLLQFAEMRRQRAASSAPKG